MSTSWFSIGIRFLSGDMARGMRQAGQNFHGMIEGQKRDLKSLGDSLEDLTKKEKAARKNLKDEIRDQKTRVANAQRDLTNHKDRIALVNSEVDALKSANKVLKNDPAWVQWDQRVRATGKAIAATRAELSRLDDLQKKMDSASTARHQTEIRRLQERRIKEVEVRDDAVRRLADLKRLAPKGIERVDSSVRSTVAGLQADLDRAIDRRTELTDQASGFRSRLKALGLQDREIKALERANARELRAQRRADHRKARQDLTLQGIEITRDRLKLSDRAAEAAALGASATSAERAAVRVNNKWTQMLRTRDRAVRRAQVDGGIPITSVTMAYRQPLDELEAATRGRRQRARYKRADSDLELAEVRRARERIQERALELATKRAGLQPPNLNVPESAGLKQRRMIIQDQVADVLREQLDNQAAKQKARDSATATRRMLRLIDRTTPSQAAVASNAEIAAQQAAVDAARGQAQFTAAQITQRELELKGELADNKAQLQAQRDAALSESARLKEQHAKDLKAEPALNTKAIAANNSAIATKTAEIANLKAGLPGLIAKVQAAFGATPDRTPLEQATAAREAQQKLFEAKRAEYQATKAHVQDLRDTRTQIKQQLWGAVYDLSSKFYMLSNAIRRIRSVITAAAQFQFNARGLSTLLGGGRGQGADVYGAYARAARYQTEVSPTAAIARMRELAAAGYSRGEIPGATAAIYNTMLASQGEVSESGAFDLGISVHKAFGNSGQDMSSLLDTVVSASNQFPMTIGKIREALGYATEAAVQTGQSLEETLVGIGMIMPITKTASKAGTIFRNAILAQAKPKGQEIMADLGVTAKDERGNNRPVLDVFADMRRAFLAVEKADMAGTWRSPTDAKLEKAKEDKADINAEMFRLRTIEKLKGKLKDPELEQIRLQIAKSYVNKNIEEAKKERAEAISRLNMKKEELEFAFTGQRGGAIFAALERLPELAKASLRGGIYEGAQFKFRDVDDALKAMRLGLIDTAGESRRMSDELRKTSQMLGVSFQVSVEKFKISLGTFLLPVRDAFTNVAMTIVNGLTSLMNGGTDPNYGQPGGSPVGSSVGMNLFGSGMMYVTVVAGVKTLITVFRTLATAKLLFQPRAIEATLAALKGGASLPEAMRSGSLVMANAAGGFASKLGMFASNVGSFLGPFAMVAGGLLAIKVALDASTNAVVDFTHVTEAAAVRRNTKFFGGVRAAFSGIAEGKIYQDPKTGEVVVPEELIKAIRSGDRFSGKVLKGLLSGRDPFEVLDEVKGTRLAELEEQYRGAPKEKRDEAIGSFLEEFTRQKDEFFGMTSEDIIRRRRAGLVADGVDPNDPRFINILGMEMNALRNRSGEEFGTRYGREKGGQIPGVLKQLMDDTHTNSVRDAMRVLGYEIGGSLSSASLLFALAGKHHEAQNPNGGFWNGVFGLSKQVGAAATGGFLGFVGMPDLAMTEDQLNIRRSDFDQQGNYLPGMPGGLVNNMEPVWDKIVKGSDSDLRSEDWLRQTVAALNKLPNALAQEIANAPAFGPNLNPIGSAIIGQFFGSPTREVP